MVWEVGGARRCVILLGPVTLPGAVTLLGPEVRPRPLRRGELGRRACLSACETLRCVVCGPLSKGGGNSKLGTKIVPK